MANGIAAHPAAGAKRSFSMDRRALIVGMFASNLLAQPLFSLAQQARRIFRLGFLSRGAPLARSDDFLFEAFVQGLLDFGYVEGRDVVFERRWGNGRIEPVAEASELARLPVDVIVAQG